MIDSDEQLIDFQLIINFADKRQKGKLMSNKNKNVLVASVLAFSLSFYAVSPIFAADTNVTTSVKITSVSSPIVKAKWEMNIDDTGPLDADDTGTDDSNVAGAQFNPSGNFGVNKNIAVCAVVTDPDGLTDIDSVNAGVFYPTNVNLGPNHQNQGCGSSQSTTSMTKIGDDLAKTLFCNDIKTGNNNLPTFNTGYDYDEICGAEGEFAKGTAAIYCGVTHLSYEDPSGNYKTVVTATDKALKTGKMDNTFKYASLTAFVTDFDKVDYGTVSIGTDKGIVGDTNLSPIINSDGATIRNVGNTRLDIKSQQDDMGLGKTNGDWNVVFDSKVGSAGTSTSYNPGVNTVIAKTLDLSETNKIDFSILVKNAPDSSTNIFAGTMVLSAISHSDYSCN
jgi:hypothetical protein